MNLDAVVIYKICIHLKFRVFFSLGIFSTDGYDIVQLLLCGGSVEFVGIKESFL